jgi:hypothetical protein
MKPHLPSRSFERKEEHPKNQFYGVVISPFATEWTLFISLASFCQFYGSSNEKVSLLRGAPSCVSVCCLSKEDDAGPKISSSRRTARESRVVTAAASLLLGFCQIKPDKWRETTQRKEKKRSARNEFGQQSSCANFMLRCSTETRSSLSLYSPNTHQIERTDA